LKRLLVAIKKTINERHCEDIGKALVWADAAIPIVTVPHKLNEIAASLHPTSRPKGFLAMTLFHKFLQWLLPANHHPFHLIFQILEHQFPKPWQGFVHPPLRMKRKHDLIR